LAKEPNNSAKGKRDNQKMKPFFVMQYLLKNTDENKRVTAEMIKDKLASEYGISANVRSICEDIKEINKAFYLLEHEDEIDNLDDAAAAIEDDEYDEEKLIVYSHSKPRGFYVKQRKLELDEVRLLAECIYTSRFVTQSEAKRLISVVDDLTTAENAKKIKPDALVTDRVRTTNKSVLNNLSVIHTAMSSKIDGKPHTPEKITFQLQYHTLESKDKPVPKKTKYVVSPYKLLVNDGNYYLSAFEDKSQQMKNYRVDRMKNVSLTGESRVGEEAYKALDMEQYLYRSFSMFGGKPEYVKLRFINRLLDTVLERFGTKNVLFSKDDDKHFTISTKVYLSEPFYAWLFGFGTRVKILSPQNVIDEYKSYINKVTEMYESD